MTNRLLHTPEGVRDIYGEELKRKNALKEKLKELEAEREKVLAEKN